ncbi:hypothetical protein CH361_16295 [Leptospira brenneri]|nr:hypothetical protein CH361_16295 [Leptospira brenneri]
MAIDFTQEYPRAPSKTKSILLSLSWSVSEKNLDLEEGNFSTPALTKRIEDWESERSEDLRKPPD